MRRLCWSGQCAAGWSPGEERERFAVLSVLLMLPFQIPGEKLLETLQCGGRVPSALGRRPG